MAKQATAPGKGDGLTRRQYVVSTLRSYILSMQWRPNTPIYELEVARTLGVSRTPVREALIALEREGLVRIVRGKGAFVSPDSAQQVLSVYEVREVLEGLAARKAAAHPPRQALEALAAVFERPPGEEALHRAADDLHRVLAEAAGNGYLRHLLSQMSEQVAGIRHVSLNRTQRTEKSTQEHSAILQAVLGGDGDGAERAMRRHIRGVLEGLSEIVADSERL